METLHLPHENINLENAICEIIKYYFSLKKENSYGKFYQKNQLVEIVRLIDNLL